MMADSKGNQPSDGIIRAKIGILSRASELRTEALDYFRENNCRKNQVDFLNNLVYNPFDFTLTR